MRFPKNELGAFLFPEICFLLPEATCYQGWELTSLVHELVQQGRELSRESVQLNSGSRAQNRANKAQFSKDLMIREPY